MNHLLKAATFLMCVALIGSAQTSKDFTLNANDGKSYKLYTLLGEGTHVVIHFTSTS